MSLACVSVQIRHCDFSPHSHLFRLLDTSSQFGLVFPFFLPAGAKFSYSAAELTENSSRMAHPVLCDNQIKEV